jgi:hypothetical protein
LGFYAILGTLETAPAIITAWGGVAHNSGLPRITDAKKARVP